MARKISDILWKAANKYLASGRLDYDHSTELYRYSCDAIQATLDWKEGRTWHRIQDFLQELGLNSFDTQAFKEFERRYQNGPLELTERSQGARYAWLMFASQIAEERGL